MDAGDEMLRDVQQVLNNDTKTSFQYSGMDYGAVSSNREKQLEACQKLRDKYWRIHACAMALEGFESSFYIRATRKHDKDAAIFAQDYKEWKDYKKQWGSVYE